MQTFEINFTIDKNEYPLLFQLKKKELNKLTKKIFNLGYSIMYPVTDSKKNVEYHEILNKIECLKDDFNNPELTEKISSLESSLEKLIGLSSSSVKKGDLAENVLENIFKQRYGDIEFKNTTHIPHSGDAWLTLPNEKIIMLESKNYVDQVNKDQIIKMQNDMINHHIKWGLFVSFNSGIQGMKELDFNIFNHNNESYHIIFISNLALDITRLDLGISLIRKLLTIYSDLQKFPWLVTNIKNELDNLNSILEHNYLLRDHFITMEKDVIKNINTFYTKLRDYQFNLDNKIKEIINKITSTMNDSIEFNNIDYSVFIENVTNKEKKLNYISTKIADILKKKIINISIENNLIKQNTIIGQIKIQTKKITIELNQYDLVINFILGKDKQICQNLIILENLNL
jgi:hypothetical protein